MHTVGVIGAGQLARMMIPAAVELGIDLRVYAEADGQSAHLAQATVGDVSDLDALRRFADGVDVITFEHEHVPQGVLRALVADGVVVRPGPDALRFAQDKAAMRERMRQLGLPQPAWAVTSTADEVAAFLAAHGGRAVLKTPRGGYDGHGVRVITDAAQAEDWLASAALAAVGGRLLIEEAVDFRRELSQQIARRPSGQSALWPLVETIQLRGVCSEAIAPAPAGGARDEEAARIAQTVASALDVTGVLAVEMFEAADGRVLINELAMRPHNSGHWTQDGATTSQFEQHLRAVLDLPLGDPAPIAPHAVMVNVLGGPTAEQLDDALASALALDPACKVHWYQKSYRPGRKVGHVNAWGDDESDVLRRARAVADALHRDH